MTENNPDLRTIRGTNRYLRSLIETPENTRDKFWIGGIVTYLYTSQMGHTYFTITDEQHSIKCMLRNQYRDKAVYLAKDTPVDVFGSISVYEKDAKLQLMVEDIRVIELDESSVDISVLQQLEIEGLYPRVRLDLPLDPSHISLITSKYSEALSDFTHIYREQGGKATIEVLDALVQGDLAPGMIVERIQEANRIKRADILVLSRGGGRNKDLAVYNSYEVTEAICKSKIPVVTGIGHQRDETVADRVADQKTISPTDAAYKLAKLSTPDGDESSPAQQKSVNSPKNVEDRISSTGTNPIPMNTIIIIAGSIILAGLAIVIMLLLQ